ncbi:PREDICTED: 39S ribosomal protein L54, mitochondrial [Polistes dominula]|uniref:Large ribosomal subunit protein mL54 n=1 Tax=Polistes dominula TaxID=743375 RepID=A0ABM1ICX7_POLDO|nr:PREDICTED: 39S ribosomal protein L54, mitochondrial [Polistes dominula]
MNKLCRILPKKIISTCYQIQTNNYAAPGSKVTLGKGVTSKKVASSNKIIHPVEKDTNKLVTYVCGSNYLKEGEDIKLKPDSEYPDWLWTIPLTPPRLEDMDPNTKQYWRRLRKLGLQNNNLKRKFR